MPRPAEDAPPPWDIQPGEPSIWFNRFTHYLNLGPERTIGRAYQSACIKGATGSERTRAPRPSHAWFSVAAAWRWGERARAYDHEQRLKLQAAKAKEVEEANKRHAMMGRGLFNKAAQALANLDPSKLSPDQLVRITDAAVRLERTALGQPLAIERHEHVGAPGHPDAPNRGVQYQPSASEVAQVMALMAEHGAIAEEPAPDPEPGQETADES